MIEFKFQLPCQRSARQVWSRLVAVDRHTRAVPLTRVRPVGATMRPGLEFVAETRLGPLRLRDRMRVERARPPGLLRPGKLVITKLRPFRGLIVAQVTASGGASTVAWHQQVASRLPGPLGGVAAKLLRRGYRASLRRIVAD